MVRPVMICGVVDPTVPDASASYRPDQMSWKSEQRIGRFTPGLAALSFLIDILRKIDLKFNIERYEQIKVRGDLFLRSSVQLDVHDAGVRNRLVDNHRIVFG